MTQGFEVSPERVRGVGTELRSLGDRFQQAVQQFAADVRGLGEPWGGDDIGMIIGLAHGAIFDAAMEAFEATAEGLGEAGEVAASIADNYDRLEETNTLYINRVSELL